MSADKRARFLELFGSDSTNFLGSGLTLTEFVKLGLAEKYLAGWASQDREEKRRRLDVVMRLSVELARIRETTNFATGLCEAAIEAVIEGDWRLAADYVDYFLFGDERTEVVAKYVPVFGTFREILSQAIRAREATPS